MESPDNLGIWLCTCRVRTVPGFSSTATPGCAAGGRTQGIYSAVNYFGGSIHLGLRFTASGKSRKKPAPTVCGLQWF